MIFGNIDKYRPIPFWSWNDKLENERLGEQIDSMREAGIGGFIMHARGGLETEYMSEEWFDRIDYCTEKGGALGMRPFAYDENGWPSGFAGGKLLRDGHRTTAKDLNRIMQWLAANKDFIEAKWNEHFK